MKCIICDAQKPFFEEEGQGREILLTPVMKVWCCDKCIEAILLNACRNAFRERCEEVNV